MARRMVLAPLVLAVACLLALSAPPPQAGPAVSCTKMAVGEGGLVASVSVLAGGSRPARVGVYRDFFGPLYPLAVSSAEFRYGGWLTFVFVPFAVSPGAYWVCTS